MIHGVAVCIDRYSKVSDRLVNNDKLIVNSGVYINSATNKISIKESTRVNNV